MSKCLAQLAPSRYQVTQSSRISRTDSSLKTPLTWELSAHPDQTATDQDGSVWTEHRCLIVSEPNQGTTQGLSQTLQDPYYPRKVAAYPSSAINNCSLF